MREKVRLVSALRGLFAGEEGLPAPLTSASAPNLFLGALAHGPKKPSALFQFSVSLRDLVALQVEAGASATLTADDAGPLLSGLADKGWLGTADAAGHWTGGADIGLRLCFCVWGMLYSNHQMRFPAALVSKAEKAFQKCGLTTPHPEAPAVSLFAGAALAATGVLVPGLSPARLLELLGSSLGGGDDKDFSLRALACLASTGVEGGFARLEPVAAIRVLIFFFNIYNLKTIVFAFS